MNNTSNQLYQSYVADIRLPPAIILPAGTLALTYLLILTVDYLLITNDTKLAAYISPLKLRIVIGVYHFLMPIFFATKYDFGNISFMLQPWAAAAQIVFLSKSNMTLREYLQTLFKMATLQDDSPTTQTHRQIRLDGLKKVARGIAKIAFMKTALDGILPHDLSVLLSMPFYSFRALFITYVLALRIYCMVSVVDIVMGAVQALTLIRFHDVFDNPFLSTSPKDFWNRRWNRLVSRMFHSLIFVKTTAGPSKKQEDKTKASSKQSYLSPTTAGLLIFLISGLFHDFMIAAAARELTFELTAFFMIHGIEVALEAKYRKGRYKQDPTGVARVVCSVLTTLFFTTTGRLFLSPVLRQEVFLKVAQRF